MTTQPYTISHTGSVLENAGEEAVWLFNNQVDPQLETEIAEFRCPSNFEGISWVGNRDPIRFEPRTHESFNGYSQTEPQETTIELDTNIQAVAGYEEIEDQPYPVAVVTVGGEEVEVVEADYADNSVTVYGQLDDTVHIFPIVTKGTVKIRGENALDQHSGPVFPWGFPIYRWHDMKQDKQGTEVNLQGSLSWERDEKLQVLVDSPTEIVWEHEEYPDAYVTTLEMDVRITI